MIDLFVCNECGHVDSIGTTHGGILPSKPEEQKCALCITGQWHNCFDRLPFNSETDIVLNRPSGFGFG